MDHLLELFETRIKSSSSVAFSEFVCLLVLMVNNLLRKQEPPSDKQRSYAIKLLEQMGAIVCLNDGATIDTTKPRNLQVHLFKDRMTNETEADARILANELTHFVEKMVGGVKL
jgi:hypothetical protein